MGSHTNSPSLLSPRRRLRGYRSLSTNWEESSDVNNHSVLSGRLRTSRNTIQCATSLLYDIVSPKCSPLVRRVHMSRLRQLLSSRDAPVVIGDQSVLQEPSVTLNRSSSTSSLESLDSTNRPNGMQNLISKAPANTRTLPPRSSIPAIHGTVSNRGNFDSTKHVQHAFVRNLFHRAFKGNRRKDRVCDFIQNLFYVKINSQVTNKNPCEKHNLNS
ncbi:unnamed protein product [Echinostoma caproni]|uniref:Uncharacterized protein n=1 Tax=Echinostoma caproni TaxID=27848 RepID=A0A183AAK6_9TREM|nr:unnamed protein product [Echinostoma caproni]